MSYDKQYYETQLGPIPCYPGQPDWEEHWERVAEGIAAMNPTPRRVIEVGCAFGMLVRHLRNRDIRAVGFDVSEYAIGLAPEYCYVGDILSPPALGRFDLAVCIEVLEHLEDRVPLAVANLCRMSNVILFSSTADDTDTESHCTVLSLAEWDGLFEAHGYHPYPHPVRELISHHARLYRRVKR